MDIILFDGDCILCNRSVRFILKRDPKAVFHFASLQSSVGKTLLTRLNIPDFKGRTIIYIENGHYTSRSTAVLKILRKTDSIWKYTYAFIFIPRFLRDAVYTFISSIRYELFGKAITCRILPQHFQERFLNQENLPEEILPAENSSGETRVYD